MKNKPEYPEGSETKTHPTDELVYIDHTGKRIYAPATPKHATRKESQDK
jgi:hypothetical protein